MKRLIITALTTILIASEGISQTSTDTTCIPNTQLKKVINRIEACKILEEELALSKEQLNLAKDRINLKDTTIAKLQLQGSNYERHENDHILYKWLGNQRILDRLQD